ncbi:hypothetical protein TKK_0015399 [Trichogramma kaykai]
MNDDQTTKNTEITEVAENGTPTPIVNKTLENGDKRTDDESSSEGSSDEDTDEVLDRLEALEKAFGKSENRMDRLAKAVDVMVEWSSDFKAQAAITQKAVLDCLTLLKLNAAESESAKSSNPPTKATLNTTSLLNSTIAPVDRAGLNNQSVRPHLNPRFLESTAQNNSRLETSGLNCQNKVKIKRDYCLDSKTDYSVWFEFLKSELNYYDLRDYIDSECVSFIDSEVDKKNLESVRDLIISRVDNIYIPHVIKLTDPLEILRKIKEIRKAESNLDPFSVKSELYTIKMRAGERVSDFAERFDALVRKYESCETSDHLTANDTACAWFKATFECCPELKSANIQNRMNKGVNMTLNEMKTCMLQAENFRENSTPSARIAASGGQDASTTNTNKTCFRCNKKGHMSPDCPLKQYNSWYCFGCKKVTDHKTDTCSKADPKNDDSQTNSKNKSNERGKGGGKAKAGGSGKQRKHPYKRGNKDKGECYLSKLSRVDSNNLDSSRIEFIADSGATEHITNKGFVLHNFEKCGGNIKCANSDESANILIDGKGTLCLKSTINNEKIELSNVLLATKASENLISLRKFADSGYCIYLDNEVLEISDKMTGKTYLTGIYEKPNWILNFEVTDLRHATPDRDACRAWARLVNVEDFADQAMTITEVPIGSPSTLGRENERNPDKPACIDIPIRRKILDLNNITSITEIESLNNDRLDIEKSILSKIPNKGMLWHLRLGHASLEYLKLLQKQDEKLQDVKFGKDIMDCDTCALAKMERVPFKNDRSRSTRVLHTIHTDTMGPISPVSFPDGNKFIIVFIDDFSRYARVYCVKSKNDSGECLENYIEHVRNLTDSTERVCYIRADNGTEFTGGKFAEVMKKEGISRDFAPPYTPELNGTAERFNKTIQYKVRALMIDSGIPASMWVLAAEAATHVYNRTPHKSLNFKTPISVANENLKSHLLEIRRFGCLSYVRVPIAENKFSERAIKAFLVGHTPTGYLLWHPQTNKFINSRHVKFNEKLVYKDKTGNRDTQENEAESVEKLVIEKEPVTFDVPTAPVETESVEEIKKPQTTARVPKRKTECVPRSMPERKAKKNKLRDPDFVYRAKIPEIKLDDVEVHANLAKINRDPANYIEAMESEHRDEWKAAVDEELRSMKENEVWIIVDKPEKDSKGQRLNLIDSKWVFKTKTEENGKRKYKARLVIRGFKDKNSYTLKETYAPVSRLSTIRTALAVINKLNLDAVQLDVKTAFLNGSLEDEIYMTIPDGLTLEEKAGKTKVCKLQRTLYGLKTSPKIWNQRFTTEVKKLGLEKDLHEPCLFTWRKEGKVAILVLYVDDIILASNCKQRLAEIKETLCKAFKMKDLGEPSKYLGMEISRDRNQNIMRLTQVEYTNKVLERFNMSESRPQNTPMVTRQVKTREMKAKGQKTRETTSSEKFPYREAIGSLMYLATVTRPDIAYAVNYLARKQVAPTEEDWKDVKRVLRYLQGTITIGIEYKGIGETLTCYTDSSFGDNSDSTSTSGYVIKLFNDPIAWRSHKQSTVSVSTCQTEYLSMSEATQEIIFLDKSIRNMLGKTMLPAKIWCDNRSAIDCTEMDGCNKLKSFDDSLEWIIEGLAEREKTGKKRDMSSIHGDYVKSCAMEGKIIIDWVNTAQNDADIMTKPLPAQSHEYLRDKILNR